MISIRALRSLIVFFAGFIRERRRAALHIRDLARVNRAAEPLNREAADVLEYQRGENLISVWRMNRSRGLLAGGGLATDGDAGRAELVAFVTYGFIGCGAQRLLIRIFRCVAITANYFFAALETD